MSMDTSSRNKIKETVCAVVVTYNRKNLLLECLEALLKQTRPLEAIYIIDNFSSDGTPETLMKSGYIAELPPDGLSEPWEREYEVKNLTDGKPIRIHYVRMNENTGGAGGFHEGVKRGYERGYDWLWLMDDDVRPHIDALSALLQTEAKLKERNKSNVLIPVRLWEDGSLAEFAALKYNLSTAFCMPSQVMVSVNAVYDQCSQLPEYQEVMNFAFEGPLIPREAVEIVGLPSKEYFIYVDDTDYAFRMRQAGFRLILVSSAWLFRMLRPEAKSKIPPWRLKYSIRNIMWLSRLYGENWSTRHLRHWLWGVRFIAAAILKGRMFSDRETFCATIQGVKEGLFFNPPQCHIGDLRKISWNGETEHE